MFDTESKLELSLRNFSLVLCFSFSVGVKEHERQFLVGVALKIKLFFEWLLVTVKRGRKKRRKMEKSREEKGKKKNLSEIRKRCSGVGFEKLKTVNQNQGMEGKVRKK